MNLIAEGAEAAAGLANPAAGAAIAAEKTLWPLIRKHLPAAIGGLAVLALVVALALTRHTLSLSREHEAAGQAQLQLVLTTTRSAAHNPGLGAPGVVPQIAALGRSFDGLQAAVDTANAAAQAAAKLDAQHQAEAAARMKALEAADAGRQDLIDSLKADAARPRPGAPCEAPDLVKEIWK